AMKENIDDGTDGSVSWSTGSLIFAPVPIMLINSPTAELQTYELENTTYAAFFQGSYELTDQLELTAGLRWTSEQREQSVSQLLLDEEPFREPAFAAIAGTPGIIPLQAAGVGLVTDLDALLAADIFTTI